MTDTAVIVTPARARELTDRIKIAVDATWSLITEAYTTRAWAALGYDSWDAYCAEEFGATRLKLPREDRKEVVGSLREAGLSTRAIAAATGNSRETVRRDLATAPDVSVGEVQGVNGKTYAASRPNLGVGDYWEPNGDPGLPDRQDDADAALATAEKRAAAPRARVDVNRTVMRALSDIDTARRSLESLTPAQLGRQDAEVRRTWAANLHEQVEALTDFHANL